MRTSAGTEQGQGSIMHARSCSVPCWGAVDYWALRAGSPQLTGAKALDHLFTDRYSDGIADHFWPCQQTAVRRGGDSRPRPAGKDVRADEGARADS